MKTDDLVTMLATGVTPVSSQATGRPMLLALLADVPVSLAMLLFGFGLRSDLMQVIDLPMFWVKLAFPLCIAVAAFLIVHRLGLPGVQVRQAWWGLAVPVVVVFVMAVTTWLSAPVADRLPLLMGVSWRSCTLSISLMAMPIFLSPCCWRSKVWRPPNQRWLAQRQALWLADSGPRFTRCTVWSWLRLFWLFGMWPGS